LHKNAVFNEAFLHSGRHGVRHVGFLEFNFLTAHTVHRVNMRQRIKFGGDQSNRCQDMAAYQFFKIAAVLYF